MDGTIVIGTLVDTEGIDQGINDIEKKVTSKGFMDKFSNMFNGIFSKISSSANKITSSIGKGMSSILKGLGSIFSSIGGIAGIIAKISLLGIIGMILLASNYSETAKTQLQEIGTIVLNLADVLAQLILPIAEVLVNLLYEAVKWIANLLNGWFGIDLYAERTDKSLKNGVKSAKALRKQLLGFDEMNILNKDGTIGGLGSSTGGGDNTPTPTPTTKRKKIIDLTTPGASDFFTFGAKDWINLPSTKKFLKKGVKDFIEEKDNILTQGAGSSIWKWLFGSNEDEAKADYTNVVQNIDDLSDNMKKLLHLPDDFNTDNLVDEFMNATTEINGDIVSVKTKSGKVIKLTKKQYIDLMESIIGKSQYGSKKQQKDMDDVENKSTATTNNIKNNWFTTFNDIIKKYPEVAQAILDGNYEIKKDYVEVKTKSGEVVRYSIDEFEKLKNKLTNVGDEGVNSADKTKTGWFTKINDIIAKATGKDNNGLEGAVTGAFNSIENNSKTTGENTKKNWLEKINDLIVGAKEKVDNYNKDPSTLKVEVEQDKKENSGSVINEVENDIKNKNKNPFVLKLLSKLDTSEMMSTIRKLAKSWPAVWKPILSKLESYGLAKGGVISYPRLASGGIINRPGRGVPLAVGGAIGGERGREAVLPLTDSQQMSYLGREIAKNIIINLTNVTELDGRQIAITTAKVMNDMQFQSNGGVM